METQIIQVGQAKLQTVKGIESLYTFTYNKEIEVVFPDGDTERTKDENQLQKIIIEKMIGNQQGELKMIQAIIRQQNGDTGIIIVDEVHELFGLLDGEFSYPVGEKFKIIPDDIPIYMDTSGEMNDDLLGFIQDLDDEDDDEVVWDVFPEEYKQKWYNALENSIWKPEWN